MKVAIEFVRLALYLAALVLLGVAICAILEAVK